MHTVKCNAMLRKDCSNSDFSSFPLSTFSLLLQAATKAVRVGTHRGSFIFFLHSSVLLFERIQDHIAGFAVSQSTQNPHLSQRSS